MRNAAITQTLSYPLRLPDFIQADALRLLDVSREVINLTITALWDRLDAFATRTNTYAYKQVEEMMAPPLKHGHRQWRAEAEQAGRILRGQAERKKLFGVVLPLLEQGMIVPKTDKRRAGKNRKTIKQAMADLCEANTDGGSTVELQSLIEQACNFYLENGCFPATYEEMQRVPVLKAGIVPYASDDGPKMGQTYRLSLDLDHQRLTLALRTPDEVGTWARSWRERTCQMSLPDVLAARLQEGAMQAPILREIKEADGSRYAVLDFMVLVPVCSVEAWETCQNVLGFDWGVRKLLTASVVDLNGNQVGRPFFLDTGPFDGRQARLRRQIDQLKVKVGRLEQQRDRFPLGDPRRNPSEGALFVLRREINRCWRQYEARNNDLGHLAANILLVLATAFDCHLLAGESLKTLKSAGRGRSAKGRWRNWRNNAQVRGALWRVLRYKCFLSGIRLEWQHPRYTSHVCPRCGSSANTYQSPEHRAKVNDWGAWLCCSNPSCLWSGSRDYAASLNIARLGTALIRHAQTTGKVVHLSVLNTSVQPVSYIGTRTALRFPPSVPRGRLIHSGRVSCNGWCSSVRLRSSYATSILLRLCG
ncbi:zinc ribbon domain-containing protein [Ktedonosporobacter rubrisoli]|nr:zinc ribbon domain-containing protein [Ktedonosporobacter rubrisoli]